MDDTQSRTFTISVGISFFELPLMFFVIRNTPFSSNFYTPHFILFLYVKVRNTINNKYTVGKRGRGVYYRKEKIKFRLCISSVFGTYVFSSPLLYAYDILECPHYS